MPETEREGERVHCLTSSELCCEKLGRKKPIGIFTVHFSLMGHPGRDTIRERKAGSVSLCAVYRMLTHVHDSCIGRRPSEKFSLLSL